MSDKSTYDWVSFETSKIITRKYSTSFSIGLLCMPRAYRYPIYSVYGFVRLADEIVDSFHTQDKVRLLNELRAELKNALDFNFSLNPVLNAFQDTVHKFGIHMELIELFLKSMEMDLVKQTYDRELHDEYVLGSAEVIGLMCLKVFLNGDCDAYERLKPSAMKLGAAFQKVNFLRDLKADTFELGRSYFPGLSLDSFDEEAKLNVIKEIENDFAKGYSGVKELPADIRLGVLVAYNYYQNLLYKIKICDTTEIVNNRIRLPAISKFRLLGLSYFRHKTNLL